MPTFFLPIPTVGEKSDSFLTFYSVSQLFRVSGANFFLQSA